MVHTSTVWSHAVLYCESLFSIVSSLDQFGVGWSSDPSAEVFSTVMQGHKLAFPPFPANSVLCLMSLLLFPSLRETILDPNNVLCATLGQVTKPVPSADAAFRPGMYRAPKTAETCTHFSSCLYTNIGSTLIGCACWPCICLVWILFRSALF